MKRLTVSQEGLKLIATVTMLLDHIGATLVYSMYAAARTAGDAELANAVVPVYQALRIIGRIAFPIYCFLLVEGYHHTRDLKKYIGRLAIGMVLAEIPFDLAVSGCIDWTGSSVMVTLLLGVLMMVGMDCMKGWMKLLAIPSFYGIAEALGTDYAGHGILLIAMLALTRGVPKEKLWRTLGFAVLLWFGATVDIGPFEVPMEMFALIGLIPMFLYEGKKHTRNKWVQWGFYLFYPVHLLVLWGLDRLIYG